MKKAVTLLVLLSLFLPLHAQKTKVQGTVTIKAREDLLKELPAEAAYFMPEFRDATVQFNDGKLSQGRINICLVDNSVRFIEESGDTLLLSNAENVMRILIGDTVMLQREGYFIKQLTAYGQKFLGVLLLGLFLVNDMDDTSGAVIPVWMMLLCSIVMGVGTSIGGKKIIKSVGMDMVKLEKYQGFSADVAASLCIFFFTILGIPVSTTHVKTTAIMGVGAVKRMSAINYAVVKDMVLTWVLTFPGCGLIGFGMAKLFLFLL